MRQYAQQFEPPGEAFGEVDVKEAIGPTGQNFGGCNIGGDQRRHGELVRRGEWGFYKARVDGADTQPLARQVVMQYFSEMGERGFGGAVCQRVG